MRVIVRTSVSSDLHSVFDRFDRSLFERLKPPLLTIQINRFDGHFDGGIVDVDIGFRSIKNRWISEIRNVQHGESECSFTDIGITLPPPLKEWTHIHRVVAAGASSVIVDDIRFATGSRILDVLIAPLLWAAFVFRKRVYKKVFGKPL